MEVCGPITVRKLAEILVLQQSEIDASLLALEAEGFILRGKFHPRARGARMVRSPVVGANSSAHDRSIALGIQPVSVHDFYRFLFAWQRADQEHRVEGLEGLRSVLEQLDGCEFATGCVGIGGASGACSRLRSRMAGPALFFPVGLVGDVEHPANSSARASAPLRTSPIALYSA